MVAEKGAALEDIDDVDTGQSTRQTERGCYGRSVREGRVRQAPWDSPRAVNTLLWVLNIVVALLLLTFVGWRLFVNLLIPPATLHKLGSLSITPYNLQTLHPDQMSTLLFDYKRTL